MPAVPSGTVAELRSGEGGPGATTIELDVTGEKPSAAKMSVRVPGSPRMETSSNRTRPLASLRALFVPRVFVQVLGMTYRYLFHLVNGVGVQWLKLQDQ